MRRTIILAVAVLAFGSAVMAAPCRNPTTGRPMRCPTAAAAPAAPARSAGPATLRCTRAVGCASACIGKARACRRGG